MFSRVPQFLIGLDREKAHSNKLCHGGIKAREELDFSFLSGLFCFVIMNLEVLIDESELD